MKDQINKLPILTSCGETNVSEKGKQTVKNDEDEGLTVIDFDIMNGVLDLKWLRPFIYIIYRWQWKSVTAWGVLCEIPTSMYSKTLWERGESHPDFSVVRGHITSSKLSSGLRRLRSKGTDFCDYQSCNNLYFSSVNQYNPSGAIRELVTVQGNRSPWRQSSLGFLLKTRTLTLFST